MSETMFTSAEVLEELNGAITYRQLDYWCREGTIHIAHDAEGSGHPRMFTQAEVDALRIFAIKYRQIHEELERLHDGTVWARAVNQTRWNHQHAQVSA